MATIFTISKGIKRVAPKDGRKFSLEEAQKIVGGYIQLHFIEETNEMIVCNEEGKLHDLLYNKPATIYAHIHNALLTDFLVGNVLICKRNEI